MKSSDSIRVSVVIPAYNAECTIKSCLRALKNQTMESTKYEIILVNDGSTDNTAEIARSEGIIVIEQNHAGPAMARNLGVQKANGDLILFTDADCIADNRFIEEMEKPFADPVVVGVKGAYRTHQKKRWARFAQVEFEERYAKLAKSDSIDFVDSHAAAFRIEIFREVGGFDPHFPVANNEDVDLSYKIARLGYRMIFNRNAIVYHIHPDRSIKYLRTKFFRAYWRMLVYRRFPEKILSDSYTPQTMKLQIFWVALFCISCFACFFLPSIWPLIAIFGAAYLISTIPFVVRILKYDSSIALFGIIAIFLRSLAFGFGIIAGFLAQRRRDLLIPSILIITDVMSTFVTYLFAYWLRAVFLADFLAPFDHTAKIYFSIFPFVIAVWLVSFHSMGLYSRKIYYEGIAEFAKVTRAIALSIFAIITVSFFLKWDYSRGFILIFWLLSILSANLSRYSVRLLRNRIRRRGYQKLRTVIVGEGDAAHLVHQQLKKLEITGVEVIGVVSEQDHERAEKAWNGLPFLGEIKELESIIRKNAIDDVYIALPNWPHKDILDLIVRCEQTGSTFKIVSDFISIVTSSAGISPFAGLPIVDLREEGQDWARRVVKRTLDLCLAILLVFLLIPIIGSIMLGIHLMIPGSICVREERVGKNGRLFKMYRFRVSSMKQSNNSDPHTWMGIFLRRSFLEELPQLFNVLRGEMSLVGPRPEVPEIVATYADWQRKRLEVPPGITGLWQIVTPGNKPLHENLEYDFYYIKNYDVWMDLSILLRTLPVVLFGRSQSTL